MTAAALLLVLAAADAGPGDPFGPRKGGGPRLAPPPVLQSAWSLNGGPVGLDGGTVGVLVPPEVALQSYALHVFASEELGPDLLRRVARQNVTLWLDTTTNMLRDSTLEVLRSSGTSFVKLTGHVTPAHQARFATLRSGVWFEASELQRQPLHWIGARAVAVEVAGAAPEEQWAAIAKARAQWVFWDRPGCDAAPWSSARALRGNVVTVEGPSGCGHAGAPVKASFRGGAPPTERAPFIWLRPDAKPEQVRALYLRDGGTKLLVSVGDRPEDVRTLGALLDALEQSRRGR